MKEKGFIKELVGYIREDKATFAVYVILRVLVIAVLVRSVILRNYESAFVCVLSLVLFLVPAFVEKNVGIRLPSTLEIIVLVFIFAAEILGEIESFYVRVPHWDTMLHTVNGFLFAAVGFSLCDIINRNSKVKFKLSPLYLTIVAFCFSMTVGVLWEFGEYGLDMLANTDAQKDVAVAHIDSVSFDSTKTNTVIHIDSIKDTVIITEDGEYRLSDYGINGYLDIGLHDTVKDMFVNFIGAVVFSFIGYAYVKQRGKGKIASSFIPVLREEAEVSSAV